MRGRNRQEPPNPCVFCGEVSPKATEDVMPQWFKRRLFPDAKGGLRTYLRRVEYHDGKIHEPDPEEDFRRDRSILAIKAYGICRKRCNGGWMSRLQNKSIDPLRLLIDSAKSGTPVILSADDASTIVKWMTMTALTADLANHKRGEAVGLAAVRRAAVDLDVKPALPMTHCWAARARNTYEDLSMVNARLSITAYGDGSTANAYFISMVLGRLVLLGHLRDAPCSVAEPLVNLNHWAPITPTGAAFPPLLTSGDRAIVSPIVEPAWLDRPYQVTWPKLTSNGS